MPFLPSARWLAPLSLAALASACSTTPSPTLAPAKPAALAGGCDSLAARLTGLPDTRITGVETVAAGTLKAGAQPVAAHCLVKGSMRERIGADGKTPYALGFEMRLPLAWNGRFLYQANGGIDGSVVPAVGAFGGGPVTSALHQGFAVISSDAGHDNRLTRGPLFGLDPQARLDYGYQAVGTLTPMAKDLVQRAYGKAPDRSYIAGCSNGGRHVMVAASRHPDMFDGFLAGAPGYNLPKAAVANIFGAQQYRKVATDPKDLGTAFTQAERQTVVRAVLERCDALDGARDGMVQDSTACQARFDLARDVPSCTGPRNGQCLTEAQKTAIAPIFRGATTRDGRPFYASFPYDTGLASPGVANWEFRAPIERDAGAVAFIFGAPPQNPAGFNGEAFALEGDIDAMLASVHATQGAYSESAMAFMTPPRPTELDAVQRRGGKLLLYHGVSDAIFSVHDTQAWYDTLDQRQGGQAARFARLFRVPGMDHCRAGPSTDQFDALTPLVRWVEEGIAPERIEASARGAGSAGEVNPDVPADWAANRSRPLCPSPKVATYRGTGSMENAASFVCR
ncbi:tannase/feruloyl esterase family alpha/beta hydrolase [Hydrogenophaga sp. NFH-34]|uniref:tannase/feruloyl esterase family alpha/beta hydrolase n=1 Tax=Hydrogenophaga sp. NFH-34 TaxID=2744446 RepID=UPI001F2584A4|nr:tannase/feruloyl esterase family alpha/beta hydrolase [Hydrogenophaga sp. NFH-34]